MAKRALSDSECDDLYSDTKDSCMTPPESCGGGTVSRKKRRGIIEKRRRDRINNSLSELRRLVPTAFEKHGSAKLEKAEILQMTVDHLKMLHAKGFDALAYDPHKFALDYHSIGFRECAAEVARYLVAVEGWDIQDPLRLRLMSHLQCFASQRELANKQASATSWGLTPPNHTYTLPNSGGIPPSPAIQPAQTLMESPPNHMNHQNYHHNTSPNMGNDLGNQPVQQQYMTSVSPGAGHRTSYSQNQNQHLNSHSHHQVHHQQNQSQNNNQMIPIGSYGMTNNNTNLAYPMHNSGGKPYRPWGAELAY